MARRVYKDEEKQRALAIYETEGLAEASRQTHIAKGTIASWAHRTGVASVCNEQLAERVKVAQLRWADRRMKMVDEIGAVAHLALAQAEAAVVEGKSRDAKDFATTLAILVDKAQLLGGDATERHESRRLRAELLAEARENARHLRSVS